MTHRTKQAYFGAFRRILGRDMIHFIGIDLEIEQGFAAVLMNMSGIAAYGIAA